MRSCLNVMLSEQEVNYRMSDVVPEVTKNHIFFKIFSGMTPPPPTGSVGNVLDIMRKHKVIAF